MENKNLVDLDDGSFEAFVASGELSIVDFWAPWCTPCKVLGPIIAEIADEMKGKVNVGKLNVDDNPVTQGKFKIMSIPTLLIFKDGKVVDQIIGVQPKDTIVKKINSAA